MKKLQIVGVCLLMRVILKAIGNMLIVERSFSRLSRFSRLARDYERLHETPAPHCLNQGSQDWCIQPQRSPQVRGGIAKTGRPCGVLCGITLCTNVAWPDLLSFR